MSNRRFSHSRRSRQAEDRPAHIIFQFTHRKKFDDPVLYLLKAIMILVQYLARIFQVKVVYRIFPPRQAYDPFDIAPDNADLRRTGRHFDHTRQFLFRLGARFFA
ncbi:hypothetical protein SDC9_192259 [bioreactor metagenome]|uniref:Uncharacterized protein n=1 Tax=bioreactor metagenome TaxID=1076179 RepID=A0A645I8S4_9ZZZZ